MLRAGQLLRTRLSRMLTAPNNAAKTTVSEADLRAMSHEQLLQYAIQNAATQQAQAGTDPKTTITTAAAATSVTTPTNGREQREGGSKNETENPSAMKIDAPLTTDSNASQLQLQAKRSRKEEQLSKSTKKRRKEFDMSRYGQRMIALKLNYQGWRFHGFASQTTSDDTVEAHLFNALLKTRLIESKESCEYSRAGRTDVGVSALAQVVGLRIRSAIVPPSTGSIELDYVKTINSALPDGMRITAWSPVCDGTQPTPCLYDKDKTYLKEYWESVANTSSGNKSAVTGNSSKMRDVGDGHGNEGAVRRPGEKFSARFDATSRSYKYFFVRSSLDLKAMSEAATMFEGRHDFRNFCRFDDSVTNFERVMYTVEIRDAHDRKVCEDECSGEYQKMYFIYVRGQAFLWHQVRCMAAVLFDVGRGVEQPQVVFDMLNDVQTGKGTFANGRPHYRLASPTPLLLFECSYPRNVVWFNPDGLDCKSLQRADDHLAEEWASESAKSSIVAEMLKDIDGMMQCGGKLDRKAQRHFIIDAGVKDKDRHIAYRLRGRDDPVSIKIQRAEKKRLGKALER